MRIKVLGRTGKNIFNKRSNGSATAVRLVTLEQIDLFQ